MEARVEDRAARSRRQILEAGAQILGKDPSASMSEVAAAAGVGRTTLHRQFGSREELLIALALEALDQVTEALAAARPGDGPAPDALARIAEAVFPLADEFRYLDLGPELWELPQLKDRWDGVERALDDVVRRGQREGDLRTDLPTALIADLFASALWSVNDSIREGRVARRDAVPGLLSALLHGVSAGGPR
jgi:AcrR family transcriptional regulator